MLADTVTPVSIYLKLRDKYANSILLESSDYHGNENNFSYICCEPISSFILEQKRLSIQYPDGHREQTTLDDPKEAIDHLNRFANAFTTKEPATHKFISNGLFGFMAYDAVQHFEDISFADNDSFDFHIPDICYSAYRYVIVIDHFKNELHAFQHQLEGESGKPMDEIIDLINNRNFPVYQFSKDGSEKSNFDDQEFLEVLQKGKEHCFRGDVFQIVLSRRFHTAFKGDDFNVYRALRSVNPSPYLFYFDYGSFKIFGSSPEAQIMIKQGEASIHPIAGTFRRTGDDQADTELAKQLYDDVKENAEHVMLVDLARNDLSRNGHTVKVETFKEIQYFSHVIHLVSKVTGQLDEGTKPARVVADTFPAGTLSGAPKHKAMTLINEYENVRRGYYGGAIGFMGFNGDFNHAIMIRSFLSQNGALFYQAGAGVVAKSEVASELQEVNNKLAALRKAIEIAASL